MKNYFLSILLVLSVLQAPARAIVSASLIATEQAGIFSHSQSNDEKDVILNNGFSSSSYSAVKRIAATATVRIIFSLQPFTYVTTVLPVADSDFSNSYLLHIYPLLNFW